MEEKETLEMCAKVSQKMKKKRRKIVNNFHPFPERFPSCCVPSANVCLLWGWLLLYRIANSFFLQGIRLLSTSSSFVRSCRQAWRRRHFFIYFFLLLLKTHKTPRKSRVKDFLLFVLHRKSYRRNSPWKKTTKCRQGVAFKRSFRNGRHHSKGHDQHEKITGQFSMSISDWDGWDFFFRGVASFIYFPV